MKPNKSNLTTLKQISQLIPPHLINKIATECGIKPRKYSAWSHVMTLVYTQLAHCLSLNDICDSLENHSAALLTIRGATPPKRNTLSHANRTRNSEMAEKLFWSVMKHLQNQHPNFGIDKQYSGFPKRFKSTVYAIDSTTIQLIASCLDWAKHRRQKAAAKCHLNLNLQTFLPSCVIIKEASTHDSSEAPKLCANLKAGEIVVFDKAYLDFKHLKQLTDREIYFVSRSKDNMKFKIIREHSPPKGNILKDQIIELTGVKTSTQYPKQLRLITAEVLVDNKIRIFTFITNNFSWAASSVVQLYQARWGIEVFFKQLKQTLKLADFLGQNKNAIQWQIWTALLSYLLLRFLAYKSQWKHSFMRILTLIRAVLWNYFELDSLLLSCGTANAPPKIKASPHQAYLPYFEKYFYGIAK